MTNRIAKTLLATAAVAALAIPAGAQANNGADDPAGHARHTTHTTTSAAHHHRHRHGRRHTRRADDTLTTRTRTRASDDRVAEVRGNDDAPNHR